MFFHVVVSLEIITLLDLNVTYLHCHELYEGLQSCTY
jgi:hypothetical protein